MKKNRKRFLSIMCSSALLCIVLIVSIFLGIKSTYASGVITLNNSDGVTVYLSGQYVLHENGSQKYTIDEDCNVTIAVTNEYEIATKVSVYDETTKSDVTIKDGAFDAKSTSDYTITVTTRPLNSIIPDGSGVAVDIDDHGNSFFDPFIIDDNMDLVHLSKIFEYSGDGVDYSSLTTQFANFSLDPNNENFEKLRHGYFKVTNNILIETEDFYGVGSERHPFKGCFDFNNNIVSLHVTETNYNDLFYKENVDDVNAKPTLNVGLFGCIENDSTNAKTESVDVLSMPVIRNLNVRGSFAFLPKELPYSNTNNQLNVGGFVGKSDGKIIYYNIASSTSISVYGYASMNVGGLFGYLHSPINNGANITSSGTENTINALSQGELSDVNVGGLCGYAVNTWIRAYTDNTAGATYIGKVENEKSGSVSVAPSVGRYEIDNGREYLIANVTFHPQHEIDATATIAKNAVYSEEDTSTERDTTAVKSSSFASVSGAIGSIKITNNGSLRVRPLRYTRLDPENDPLAVLNCEAEVESNAKGNVFAGGLYGYIDPDSAQRISFYRIATDKVETKNYSIFDACVTIKATQRGVGDCYAGGIFAYQAFKFSSVNGPYNVTLTDAKSESFMHVLANQTSSAMPKSNNHLSDLFAGFYSACLPDNYIMSHLTFTVDEGHVEARRDVGATINGPVHVGGLSAKLVGDNAQTLLQDVTVNLYDCEIFALSLSFDSVPASYNLHNNLAVGGLIGHLTNCGDTGSHPGMENVKVNVSVDDDLEKLYYIKAIHNASPLEGEKQDHLCEAYAGGVVGYLDNSHVKNINVQAIANDKKGNILQGELPKVNPTIYLSATNNPNTSAVGGLVGETNCQGNSSIKNVVVRNLNVVGNAYSSINTNTEEYDVYAGGAIGVLANNGYRTSSISNIRVYNSKIECVGDEKMITYAGGIVGGSWWGKQGQINLSIDDCVVVGSEVIASSVNFVARSGGIAGLIQSTEISNCLVIDSYVRGASYRSKEEAEKDESHFSYVGGIYGKVAVNGWNATVKNCVSNAYLSSVDPNIRLSPIGYSGTNYDWNDGQHVYHLNNFFDSYRVQDFKNNIFDSEVIDGKTYFKETNKFFNKDGTCKVFTKRISENTEEGIVEKEVIKCNDKPIVLNHDGTNIKKYAYISLTTNEIIDETLQNETEPKEVIKHYIYSDFVAEGENVASKYPINYAFAVEMTEIDMCFESIDSKLRPYVGRTNWSNEEKTIYAHVNINIGDAENPENYTLFAYPIYIEGTGAEQSYVDFDILDGDTNKPIIGIQSPYEGENGIHNVIDINSGNSYTINKDGYPVNSDGTVTSTMTNYKENAVGAWRNENVMCNDGKERTVSYVRTQVSNREMAEKIKIDYSNGGDHYTPKLDIYRVYNGTNDSGKPIFNANVHRNEDNSIYFSNNTERCVIIDGVLADETMQYSGLMLETVDSLNALSNLLLIEQNKFYLSFKAKENLNDRVAILIRYGNEDVILDFIPNYVTDLKVAPSENSPALGTYTETYTDSATGAVVNDERLIFSPGDTINLGCEEVHGYKYLLNIKNTRFDYVDPQDDPLQANKATPIKNNIVGVSEDDLKTSGEYISSNGTITIPLNTNGLLFTVRCLYIGSMWADRDQKDSYASAYADRPKYKDIRIWILDEIALKTNLEGCTFTSNRKVVTATDFQFTIAPSAGYGSCPKTLVIKDDKGHTYTLFKEVANVDDLMNQNLGSTGTFSAIEDQNIKFPYEYDAKKQRLTITIPGSLLGATNNEETKINEITIEASYYRVYNVVFDKGTGYKEFDKRFIVIEVVDGTSYPAIYNYVKNTIVYQHNLYGFDFKGYYLTDRASSLTAYGTPFADMATIVEGEEPKRIIGPVTFYARWTYNVYTETPYGIDIISTFPIGLLEKEGNKLVPIDLTNSFEFRFEIDPTFAGTPKFQVFNISKVIAEDGTVSYDFTEITTACKYDEVSDGYRIDPNAINGIIFIKVFPDSIYLDVGESEESKDCDVNVLDDGIFTVQYNMNYGQTPRTADTSLGNKIQFNLNLNYIEGENNQFTLPAGTSIRLYRQVNKVAYDCGSTILQHPTNIIKMSDLDLMNSIIKMSEHKYVGDIYSESFFMVITLPKYDEGQKIGQDFELVATVIKPGSEEFEEPEVICESYGQDAEKFVPKEGSDYVEDRPTDEYRSTLVDYKIFDGYLLEITSLDNGVTIKLQNMATDTTLDDYRHKNTYYVWCVMDGGKGTYNGKFGGDAAVICKTSTATYYAVSEANLASLSGITIQDVPEQYMLLEVKNLIYPASGVCLYDSAKQHKGGV